MEIVRQRIFISALLHDIGKFYQRADHSFSDLNSSLSEESKSIADMICPVSVSGNFGYQHTVWTLQFLDDVSRTLKKVPSLLDNIFEGNSEDTVYRLASFHHKPSTELESLISLADWWSAGIDRRNSLELENDANNGQIHWGKSRYKRIPLYSIFNGISVNGKNGGKGISAFGLSPLTLQEKDCFPRDVDSVEKGISQGEYSKLWRDFMADFDKLPTDTFEGFSESLIFLLKKYTWCIPSNTTDMSNVSLFDHLKTTAAFADCLYQYKQENPDDIVFADGRLKISANAEPVILLGGDLSGIQKFIYNIASQKAAVSLKGRSFYLQLLIDSIIQRVIQHPDIEATLAHIVYSSGGKFYMLLPNTEKVKCAIGEIKKDLEAEMWEQHQGQLIVNLNYVPFSYDISGQGINFGGKVNQQIGSLWKALADKLNSQKYLKFNDVLQERFEQLFEVQPVGGDVKVCAVTGIELDTSDCVELDSRGDKESVFVSKVVKEQSDLGKTLKSVDYIVTHKSDAKNKYIRNRVKMDIYSAGVHNYMFDQLELTDDDADFRRITSADTCRVKRVNNTDFLRTPLKGNGCSYGFQFYGGNTQAQTSGRDKTFEELADKTYLGILRMDVDNLGSIFIKGLPEKDKSFSAYSTLSFMLDYFFSGYLNVIRENVKYKDCVNVLYSGGDDVFAVGRWDKLIDFASDIRNSFKAFVGRDDISISAGISIVGNKYPIAKGAELAGIAEHRAKKDNNAAKDSINIFGETVSWKGEFGYVQEYKDQFVDLIEVENMSKAILHKIMTYGAVVRSNKEKEMRGEKPDLSFWWHTAYYLSRLRDRHKSNRKIVYLCDDLKDRQLTSIRSYELIAVAARWAELELRSKS